MFNQIPQQKIQKWKRSSIALECVLPLTSCQGLVLQRHRLNLGICLIRVTLLNSSRGNLLYK